MLMRYTEGQPTRTVQSTFRFRSRVRLPDLHRGDCRPIDVMAHQNTCAMMMQRTNVSALPLGTPSETLSYANRIRALTDTRDYQSEPHILWARHDMTSHRDSPQKPKFANPLHTLVRIVRDEMKGKEDTSNLRTE